MPELPDIELYLHALKTRIVDQEIERIRLASPFLVRSFSPSIDSLAGRRIVGLRRLGKRIVWEMEGLVFAIFHLMIAGRFQWKPPGAKIPAKLGLAAFDFASGTVLITEAGSKRRASLYIVSGQGALQAHDPGGLEVLDVTAAQFRAALRRESHTVKRALTDPRLLSGIGNAYSDEILHAAKMSPMKLTSQLTDAELDHLYEVTTRTLIAWRDRLIEEAGAGFPEKVTAFREGMAVHGRYGKACPVCGTRVQRIRYAANEANYCPTCQTGGKLLADRSLSRLLKGDWPRSLEDLEQMKSKGRT